MFPLSIQQFTQRFQGDGASAVLICNELGCLEAFHKRRSEIGSRSFKAWIAEVRSQAVGEEMVSSEF